MQDFKNNVIDAELCLTNILENLSLHRVPVLLAENEGYPFQFKRKQFYIKLFFVMTIKKAQGQTIPNIGVYLPHSVYSQCQLCIALSRGTLLSITNS
ncbi:hypothetical protein Pfo_008229 [Paulownia fortunei]|nr:hypothetical protein Pfo_008229 [Paulownia fortunei]